jgi:hypothetical protein
MLGFRICRPRSARSRLVSSIGGLLKDSSVSHPLSHKSAVQNHCLPLSSATRKIHVQAGGGLQHRCVADV